MSLEFTFKNTDRVAGSNVIRRSFQFKAAECLKQRDDKTVRM